jgi:hypothetical protein
MLNMPWAKRVISPPTERQLPADATRSAQHGRRLRFFLGFDHKSSGSNERVPRSHSVGAIVTACPEPTIPRRRRARPPSGRADDCICRRAIARRLRRARCPRRPSKSAAPGEPSDQSNRAGVGRWLRASEGRGGERLHANAQAPFNGPASAVGLSLSRRCVQVIRIPAQPDISAPRPLRARSYCTLGASRRLRVRRVDRPALRRSRCDQLDDPTVVRKPGSMQGHRSVAVGLRLCGWSFFDRRGA